VSWAALAARGRHAQRGASRYRQMRGRRIVNPRGCTLVHDARVVRKSGTTARVKVKACDWPFKSTGSDVILMAPERRPENLSNAWDL